jgi:hypothetical protein
MFLAWYSGYSYNTQTLDRLCSLLGTVDIPNTQTLDRSCSWLGTVDIPIIRKHLTAHDLGFVQWQGFI